MTAQSSIVSFFKKSCIQPDAVSTGLSLSDFATPDDDADTSGRSGSWQPSKCQPNSRSATIRYRQIYYTSVHLWMEESWLI